MHPPLPARRLGASALHVSAIGLGLMSLSGTYGASSDENGLSVIHRALDSGITFLDSADMYGWGHNETLVGQALKGRRDGVVLADAAATNRVDQGEPQAAQGLIWEATLLWVLRRRSQ